MTTSWILGAISTGPLLYILVTLISKPVKSTAEYEYGARNLNPSAVLDSSIMYALQVAAVALFATWGYLYGFVAVMVPVFWMAGYILMALVLSDRFLNKFAIDDGFRTLHDYISGSGKSKTVCIVAAMLTIVGLAGPAMFEVFTVGRALAATTPIIGPVGGSGLALAFLFVAVIYMTRGGFPGVVRLDHLQLAIGYGGFSIAFALSLYHFSPRINGDAVFWIGLVCLVSTSAFAVLKYYNHRAVNLYLNGFNPSNAPSNNRDILGWFACSLSSIAFLISIIASRSTLTSDSVSFYNFFTSNSSFGFTVFATLSLFVANALYQFVDVTQWQRLLSIEVNRTNLPSVSKILRINILIGGACSSLTWVIAIAFGVFLKHLFPNPTTDAYSVLTIFISEISKGIDFRSSAIAFIFIVSMIAVMFSTLDSLVSATAFTVQNDLLPNSIRNSNNYGLIAARSASVIVIVLQLIFYLIVSELAGNRVDAVLYVCWSFQLAMLPVVIGVIIDRSGAYYARAISMLSGSLAAVSPLVFGSAEIVYEYSPWLSVLFATVSYMLFGGLLRVTTKKEHVLAEVTTIIGE